MNGWTDEWMDGWMDGRMDGWTDGWTVGQMDKRTVEWKNRHLELKLLPKMQNERNEIIKKSTRQLYLKTLICRCCGLYSIPSTIPYFILYICENTQKQINLSKCL